MRFRFLAKHGRWEDCEDAWFGPLPFGGLLLFLIFAAFPDVILGDRTFFYRDFGIFGYPLAFHHRESLWTGEIPLWNPFNTFGLPFLAQWNTLVCYPLSLLYLLFPVSWALGVFCLVHLFMAGLGMYFLSFGWSQSRLGACIAGVCFAFGGLALSCLKWPNNIAALGWMPWVVWLVQRGYTTGGRPLILAGVAGAFQMLCGAPEIILFTWLISTILLLPRMLTRQPVGAEAGRHDEKNAGDPRLAMLFRFLLLVAIVAGLAAVQLLPFVDLLLHSQRNSGFADSSWSMPVWGWANFFVPLFRCFPSYQGVFAQYEQYWVSSYYAGMGVVLLAGVALCRARKWRLWVLGLLVIGSVALALGRSGYVYEWLANAVALVKIVRFPVKFVVVAVFILPILSAFGMRILSFRTERPRDKARGLNGSGELRMLVCVGGVMLGIIGVITWFASAYPLETDDWPATWKSAASRAGFLGAIVVCLAGWVVSNAPRTRTIAGLVLLGLLWIDLYTHAPRLSPTIERWAYDEGLARNELKMEPEPGLGRSRAMVTPYADYRLNHITLTNAVEDYLYSRMSLFANGNLLDRIPKVDGFFSLYVQSQDDVRSLLYSATNTSLPMLERFLGVSQTTSPRRVIEWDPRTNYLPFVTGGQAPVFADATKTLQGLATSDFDPDRVVYLPEAAERESLAREASSVEIEVDHMGAHEIRFQIEAARPAWIVVAQTFYHPWKVFLDGRRIRLWPANHAFQAFEAPAGRTRARLVYVDWAFRVGGLISLSTLVTVLVLWRRMTCGGRELEVDRCLHPQSGNAATETD